MVTSMHIAYLIYIATYNSYNTELLLILRNEEERSIYAATNQY